MLNDIMHYLTFGCFLLVLVNLSAAAHFRVQQKPRFYGVKTGKQAAIICLISDPSIGSVKVNWYKEKTYKGQREVFKSPRAHTHLNTTLFFDKVEMEDSGIYYCEVNKTFGPGTELQVFRHTNTQAASWRSNMKDLVIFLQTFLLLLCIILPLIWQYKLSKKEEAVYEEPEIDHTYEGLAIEHCGGDLYEDIRVYSQAQEASWEVQEESPECPEFECPEQE